MRSAQQQDCIELYTRPELHASTLWLHGQGATGTDMDSFITHMHRSRELGLHHLAPNAGLRRLTIRNGLPMRAWFDIKGDPAEVGEDAEGIRESSARIHALLDDECDRGIPSTCILLGGFSQGASLALFSALRYAKPLAGAVMFAGELLLEDTLQAERHPANASLPILLLHGRRDENTPIELARHARDRLSELGHPVELLEFDLAHEVSLEQIARMDDWAFPLLQQAIRLSEA